MQHDGKSTSLKRTHSFQKARNWSIMEACTVHSADLPRGFPHYCWKTKAKLYLPHLGKNKNTKKTHTPLQTGDTFWMSEPIFRLSASATPGTISFGSVLKMNSKRSPRHCGRDGMCTLYLAVIMYNLKKKKLQIAKRCRERKKNISTDVSIK